MNPRAAARDRAPGRRRTCPCSGGRIHRARRRTTVSSPGPASQSAFASATSICAVLQVPVSSIKTTRRPPVGAENQLPGLADNRLLREFRSSNRPPRTEPPPRPRQGTNRTGRCCTLRARRSIRELLGTASQQGSICTKPGSYPNHGRHGPAHHVHFRLAFARRSRLTFAPWVPGHESDALAPPPVCANRDAPFPYCWSVASEAGRISSSASVLTPSTILANARATASMPAPDTSSGTSRSVCLCSGDRIS